MLFKKTQSVVGGVNNDTGIGVSHSMSALSLHSRVTQQLPGTGEGGHGKCLYVFELFDCYLRWAATDQVSALNAQFNTGLNSRARCFAGLNREIMCGHRGEHRYPGFQLISCQATQE